MYIREKDMKLLRCDHCRKTEKLEDEKDYVENWETVVVSTHFHYDICDDCSPLLFEFFLGLQSIQKVDTLTHGTNEKEGAASSPVREV